MFDHPALDAASWYAVGQLSPEWPLIIAELQALMSLSVGVCLQYVCVQLSPWPSKYPAVCSSDSDHGTLFMCVCACVATHTCIHYLHNLACVCVCVCGTYKLKVAFLVFTTEWKLKKKIKKRCNILPPVTKKGGDTVLIKDGMFLPPTLRLTVDSHVRPLHPHMPPACRPAVPAWSRLSGSP